MKKLNILMNNYRASITALAKAKKEEKEAKKAYIAENGRIFSKANKKTSEMREVKALRELESDLEDLIKKTRGKYDEDSDYEDSELDKILSPFVDKMFQIKKEIAGKIQEFLDEAHQEIYDAEYDASKERAMEEASLKIKNLEKEVKKARDEVIDSPSFPLTREEFDKVFNKISDIREWNQKKDAPEFEVDEDGDIVINFIAFDKVETTFDFDEPRRNLSWLDEYDEAIDAICDEYTEGIRKILPKEKFVVAVEACDVSDYDVVEGNENDDGDYYGDCEIAIDVPVKLLIIKKEKEEK